MNPVDRDVMRLDRLLLRLFVAGSLAIGCAFLFSGCGVLRDVAADQAKLATKEKIAERLEEKVSVEARQEFEVTWDAGEPEVALVDATINLVEPVLAEKAAKRIESVDPERAAKLRSEGFSAISGDLWGYLAAGLATLGAVGVWLRWALRKVMAFRSLILAIRDWARRNDASELLNTIEDKASKAGVKRVLDAEVKSLGAKVDRIQPTI